MMKARLRVAIAGLGLAVAIQQSPSVQAQTPAKPSANPIVDSIKSGQDIVKGYITKSAAMLDEKDYTFKPAGVAAEVRNFGQLFGHIANANYLLCGGAMGASTVGGERGPGGADYEKTTSKAELQKALAASFAYCDKAFAAVTDRNGVEPVTGLPIGPTTKIGALAFNVAHDFEHYGNIVTYLRAKGLVPPSSQR
jgi:uncharacterized damage-inducible protein DinB